MISSTSNGLVQRARKLHKRSIRDKTREFLVEGATGVREATTAGAPLDVVFVDPSQAAASRSATDLALAGIPVQEVSSRVMQNISATVTPQGIVAICAFIDKAASDEAFDAVNVVLNDVRDPGNVGTILRSAWASGAKRAFLTVGTADVYNPKVVRASAGAVFNLDIYRDVDVEGLVDRFKNNGVLTVAADAKGQLSYDRVDMSSDVAIILGNEASGIPQELALIVDEVACIPMSTSAESLNVAIAGAILLFEAARQRRTH